MKREKGKDTINDACMDIRIWYGNSEIHVTIKD